MLLDDGGSMSAAELAAMRAELEAYKVSQTCIVHVQFMNASSNLRQTPADIQLQLHWQIM